MHAASGSIGRIAVLEQPSRFGGRPGRLAEKCRHKAVATLPSGLASRQAVA
jgi:hypothetical protein